MYAFNDDKSKADIVLNTGAWNDILVTQAHIDTTGATIELQDFEEILDAYHEIAVVFEAKLSNPVHFETRGTIIFGSNMANYYSKICLDGDNQYQTYVSFTISGTSVTATFSSVVKRSEQIYVHIYGIGPKA